MSPFRYATLRVASSALALMLAQTLAHAQTSPLPPDRPSAPGQPAPLDVTVTAERIPTAIQRTGSAVTVLRAAEIERGNPASLVDVLRTVPGVDISETGGPGATTTIRLRGANSGQTLVLLDGVRLNDPSGASGEFDASLIPPGLIDRIEVLRGPQSGLYGSDAIGGVVNILTRKGRGAPSGSIRVEGGSYGTLSTAASVAGAVGPWSFAASGVAQRSDGFSRYGYRIGRLAARGPFTPDGYEALSGFARIGYDPGTGFRFALSLTGVNSFSDYDAAFGAFPDTPARARRRFGQVAATVEYDALDGALTHSLKVFANRTDRRFRDVGFGLVGGVRTETSRSLSDFIGDRYGAEYQATLRLQHWGTVLAGVRAERETMQTFSQSLVPVVTPRTRTDDNVQDTLSAFALWQLPVGERLRLSLAARHDHVSDARGFTTGRITAAWLMPETGTKLRASVGTGAKAPTLFQRFSPFYGTASLKPETSLGFDVGIDQSFWNGRVDLSVTGFSNRIENLITFTGGTPPCRVDQPFGCYDNVARANTAGVEVAARAQLIEGVLDARATYTFLEARDARTRKLLARRPQHTGRFALAWTPLPGLTIEPSVVLVSERFSSANERDRLKPYARVDVAASYQVNERLRLHARVENLTDARYEEVRNYGTTGRAFYAGLTATW